MKYKTADISLDHPISCRCGHPDWEIVKVTAWGAISGKPLYQRWRCKTCGSETSYPVRENEL